MNCRCRTIASLYVGADIQGDLSSICSPLALPVPSSYTSAFTPPSSVAPNKVFFSAYIDPDALRLPVPFFSTRALQRQRCEGHASSRGTGSVYQAGRSLAGAPAAPKRMSPPASVDGWAWLYTTGTGLSAGTERSADSNGADDEMHGVDWPSTLRWLRSAQ